MGTPPVLTTRQIDAIRSHHNCGVTHSALARKYGVNPATIKRARTGARGGFFAPSPPPDKHKWKSVDGFGYEVSDDGRVRNSGGRSGSTPFRLCKLWTDRYGYKQVYLKRADAKLKRMTVHSLVAAAFIGPRGPSMQINHKNGVKADNRVSNLEYCTNAENHQHRFRVLGHQPLRGEQVGGSKLTDAQAITIRKRAVAGERQVPLAREYGVTPELISLIRRGKTRKHLWNS